MLCYWKDFSIGDKLSVAGMAGSMGQAGMGSYYGPAAAYGSLSAASMAAAAAAAAQQSAAAMSAGLAAPAQVSRCAGEPVYTVSNLTILFEISIKRLVTNDLAKEGYSRKSRFPAINFYQKICIRDLYIWVLEQMIFQRKRNFVSLQEFKTQFINCVTVLSAVKSRILDDLRRKIFFSERVMQERRRKCGRIATSDGRVEC